MLEFTDNQPQLHVQESEYLRLLGFPKGHELGERPRELAAWARSWYAEHGQPWIFARRADGLEIGSNHLRLSGAEFVSDRLQTQFAAAEAHDAMLVAVSAGKECEEKARQCWQEGKPDEYFFLEMFGSAVVENLVTRAAARICAKAEQSGLAVLPHYSPGYSGWPVSDQVKLWRILRGKNGTPFPADLDVMETGMLRPKKSLLAVFGLTRHVEKVQPGSRLIPCENCSLPNCQYRRAPYRYFMPQPEMIGRESLADLDATANFAAEVLDKSARYTVNARALKKWSQERLQIETEADGFIRATFRYEGTTCSNLGRPIVYNYQVRLQSRSESYRIVEVCCAPVEGDIGHLSMCEYLKDGENFLKKVSDEKPMLGRPLNEIFTWKRSINPAGCFCDAASREHKWGMIFEVIHFALAQKEVV